MVSEKNKIKELKGFFSNIPNFLVKHFFITLFCLLILSLILSSILFSKYYLQKKDLEFQIQTLGLNEELFNDVLEEWQRREEVFKAVDFGQYLDFFRSTPD